ncbi:DUF2573 family protein [Bacillus seohaeanensis]|jgi:hypothetical protein|uniref:DUF2573 family protein n=1 Tax=Bacillus seohaeanensis TaxID=284580 RepID=A0ABW5RRI9_9BACI
MNEFEKQFEALVEKYTELLIGESTEKRKDMVTKYALYSFIAKNMPPLVKHWNSLYPEAKDEMKTIIGDIKEWNEMHRMNQKKQEDE